MTFKKNLFITQVLSKNSVEILLSGIRKFIVRCCYILFSQSSFCVVYRTVYLPKHANTCQPLFNIITFRPVIFSLLLVTRCALQG